MGINSILNFFKIPDDYEDDYEEEYVEEPVRTKPSRPVQNEIENELSKAILSGTISREGNITASLKDGKISIGL